MGWWRHRAVLAGLGLLGSPLRATDPSGEVYDDYNDYAAPAPPPAGDTSIPDKVGVEVHLAKAERAALRKLECGMCRAILKEMHVEVQKHGMTKKGVGSESEVFETTNAICLAMLQKYRLDLSAATPKLERKAEDEDEMAAMTAGGQDGVRAMLVLKMGCQQWIEDYGADTSGFIFKAVRDGSKQPETVADDFCFQKISLCGKGKKEKREKARKRERERLKERAAKVAEQEREEEKQKKDDPFSSLPEDSKAGLQRMLEMARDDPLHYMEDDAKERVRQARIDLRCDVCRYVLEDVHREIATRPKSMRRETDILPFFEGACEGGKDLSVPSYFGVEPPPLPPVWTDRVRPKLQKKSKKYALGPFPGKAMKMRQEWRAATREGDHKPPPAGESEADMMMTLACRDVVEPASMTETLFHRMVACESADAPPKCDAALAAAGELCKTAAGAACAFGAGADAAEAASKEEL